MSHIDPIAEREAREWIEAIVGKEFPDTFAESLKDGVILCKLINKIKPGSVPKFNEPATMPFKKMENIANFLKATRTLGMKEFEMFSTPDLYDEKNIGQVILTITALGRLLQTIMPDAPFPKLGVKVLEKTERVFTEDQLREARMAVSVLNLGSSNMGRQAFESVLQGKQALADVVGEGTKVQAIKTTVRAPEIVAAEAAAAEAKKSGAAATTSAPVSLTASTTTSSSASASTSSSSSSNSSSSSTSLPAGWKELKTSDGRTYFFNESANKTQWEKPGEDAAGSSALPAGWVENKTPEGKAYYYHAATKKTQWEKPTDGGGSAPLPSGWEELKTSDGKVYFYNDSTKSTQWDRPT